MRAPPAAVRRGSQKGGSPLLFSLCTIQASACRQGTKGEMGRKGDVGQMQLCQ